MIDSQLEARIPKGYVIAGAIAVTASFLLMDGCIAHFSLDYFNFGRIGAGASCFWAMLAWSLYSWIRLFDKQPQLIINKEGIWLRKNRLTFAPLQFIEWTDIQYFFLLSKKQRGDTFIYLCIHLKERENDFKFKPDGLDKSREDILDLLRKAASIYNFHELDMQYITVD